MGWLVEGALVGAMAIGIAAVVWRRFGRGRGDDAELAGTRIRHPARLVAGGGVRRIS
jgi:hypothetical protein